MRGAADAVQALIVAHGVEGLEVQSALKTDPRGDVFKATLAGRSVILKAYKGDDAADQARDAARELRQLEGHMAQGPNQVTQLCAVWPEAGLVVLSLVAGTTLTNALDGADEATRRKLFQRAGEWASHYGTGRRCDDEIAPRFWIKKAAEFDRNALTTAQLETRRALMARLRAIGPELRDRKLPRSAVHGDLIGANVMVDGAVLTGVDINGTLIRPLAWEAAHFLVWQALRAPFPKGQAAYLDQIRRDKVAFLGGHESVEDDITLHFFMTYQCCVRLAAYAEDATRANALRWLVQEVLG